MENGLLGHLPGHWVDPASEIAQPWTTAEGIVKFIEFPVRIPEMSHRAFHLYWQKHHSPNVMNLTPFAQFMRKYNTGHVFPTPTAGLPERYRQDHPYEGAAEVWINRWQEVDDWLGHPLYPVIIQPDEPRFIAQDGSAKLLVTKEERIFSREGEMIERGKIKLYLAVRRQSGITRAAFHAALSVHFRTLADDRNLARHLEQLVLSHRLPDPNPLSGLPDTEIDAVIEILFADRLKLQAFLGEPGFIASTGREAEIIDSHAIMALVAKMHVVHDEFSFQPSVTQPLAFSWVD